MQIAYNAPVLI